MNLIKFLSLMLIVTISNSTWAQVGNNQGVLNPNIAKQKELISLPELNEALVKIIIKNRPISSNSQLNALLEESLNKEQKAALYEKLFLPINLNLASRDEILLVPGINRRMAHEFEEYRPYKSMQQFRREIGKYVDEEEVARFEQYVFVPMNLNSASSEDFTTIPGMGRRMVHEFEEYRPYTSIKQFRREIGKYVDENEVARLERYIEIK